MPKVFITQAPHNMNFTSARKFGELVQLLPDNQVTINCFAQTLALNKALANAKPEDFLVLVGDPVIIGLASIIMAKIVKTSFTMLKWDKQTFSYIPIKVML